MVFEQPEITSQSDNTFHLFNPSGFKLPLKKKRLQSILKLIEQNEGAKFSLIELVFVDEEEIVKHNKKYLNRDYVTDIITFRYDEESSNLSIEGTLYCCAPRIDEQAEEYNSSRKEEFYRIYIHGLLHLIGYTDQDDEQQAEMREKEDFYLAKSNID
jgi:probable rRNA maturation factor